MAKVTKTKITKSHIICHLLSVNGPMTKAELLRQTAVIEGKPYRAASNGGYFAPLNNPNSSYRLYGAHKTSLVANGSIEPVGKQGCALLYNLTPKGRKVAQEYKQIVGM